MWCSRIRVPFRKLIEYNPTFFSKNEYIHMTERLYEDEKFGPGRRTFHIYCTACDSLVFICENTEKCADKHLNECIAKIEERRVAYYRSILWKRKSKKALSGDEIDVIYGNIYFRYRKSTEFYCSCASKEIKKSVAYRLINSAKLIQQAWRSYKLRPETLAKRVWNMVRNDSTPDRKKYLGILLTYERKINPQTQEEYDFHTDEYVNCLKKAYNENIAQKYIKEYLTERATRYKEYIYYSPSDWAEMKKYQLYNRLNTVAYIVAFIVLHQQGYRIVTYGDWSYMLKWLSNPEYYRINEYYNNGNVNFVKSSEYAHYRCKITGKPYPCDSLEIDYFKSEYGFTIEGKFNIIDFSDSNTQVEQMSLSQNLPGIFLAN
ncbi:hypothetical protein RirG_058760 [Rhizophagus irregularis DAOM 197198w]|uniref:Uncharacterized protein n=4 Tax=Rhizophagus irregularis TaxID=588596 RepID=A0A015K1V2_RHIIW|nr:hypothetical protein RirG_058760 [Rhizophagus irregularis DAOM 197198w]